MTTSSFPLWLSTSKIRFDSTCVQSNKDLKFNLSVSSTKSKTHVLVFKIKTNNPKRYFVKPKRKILDDEEKHKVQITVYKKEYRRIMQDSMGDSQQDKFLIQTLSIARENLKDLSEEEMAKEVELRWKEAEIKAKNKQDPFQYKYLSTKFEDISVERSTEDLYEEFVSLRRSYEKTVADSIGHMAREERLRNQIARLKKELRSKSSSIARSEEPAATTSSNSNPPSVCTVHLLIVSMACFTRSYPYLTVRDGSSIVDVTKYMINFNL